jgi:hypothetical protein
MRSTYYRERTYPYLLGESASRDGAEHGRCRSEEDESVGRSDHDDIDDEERK